LKIGRTQTPDDEEAPMTIKGPNCGAAGRVPTGSQSATRRTRCRNCGVSFDSQSAAVIFLFVDAAR
jgi:hypothetical protein